MRETFIIHSRLSWRALRAEAASNRTHGLQAIAIEQLTARLAGGFLQPIDADELEKAIAGAAESDLGEFNEIKWLPGFARAAAETLDKAWLAGIDFGQIASVSGAAGASRLQAIISLESEALNR